MTLDMEKYGLAKHWECLVLSTVSVFGDENEWFAQKIMLDMLKRYGCIKLYIYSLNDTQPPWLQLMIKKMWVVVWLLVRVLLVELHIGYYVMAASGRVVSLLKYGITFIFLKTVYEKNICRINF